MQKLLLLFLTLILFFIQPLMADRAVNLKKMKEEQRIALVIGNNKYNNLTNLNNPINDARAMKQILKSRGFEVIYKENANKREMRKLLREFSHKISRGGVGLYYFAGHGVNVHGNNFLIASDSVLEYKDEVELESLSLNSVTKKMKNARNRLNIIILDACRNDPFSRSGGGGLAPISNAKGIFVAYATEAGGVASDGRGDINGVFTKNLIKNIQIPGATIEKVFKNTRRDVQAETYGKQSPGVYNQIIGDFYFTFADKGTYTKPLTIPTNYKLNSEPNNHQSVKDKLDKSDDFRFGLGIGFGGGELWMGKGSYSSGVQYQEITDTDGELSLFVKYHWNREQNGWYNILSIGTTMKDVDVKDEDYTNSYTTIGLGAGYKWIYNDLFYLNIGSKIVTYDTEIGFGGYAMAGIEF